MGFVNLFNRLFFAEVIIWIFLGYLKEFNILKKQQFDGDK